MVGLRISHASFDGHPPDFATFAYFLHIVCCQLLLGLPLTSPTVCLGFAARTCILPTNWQI